tara:strand:- start:3404 stop:4216 length:813 start_codon:yes stop_codon:yes gene_type:complete
MDESYNHFNDTFPMYNVNMNKNDGNALFLILIAVALFAALSYAVTNSGRGGGGIDRETAEIHAAEILNYIAIVEAEARKLNIINGVPIYNINFGNDNSHTSQATGTGTGEIGNVYNDNPNCTAPRSECSVFQERGGQVTSRAFYDAAGIPIGDSNGHIVPGEFRVFNNFVEDVGSNSAPEILFALGGIDQAVCNALNRKFGLPAVESQPAMATNTRGRREYWDDVTDYATRLPNASTAYIGERAFCVENGSGLYSYMFYYVFHAGYGRYQ